MVSDWVSKAVCVLAFAGLSVRGAYLGSNAPAPPKADALRGSGSVGVGGGGDPVAQHIHGLRGVCESTTGETCRVFGCSPDSGAQCHSGRCICGSFVNEGGEFTPGKGDDRTAQCGRDGKCLPLRHPTVPEHFLNSDEHDKETQKILCPVLAAMYRAGDLVTEKDEHGKPNGVVTKRHLACALHSSVGASSKKAYFQAWGVAGFKKDDPDQTNLIRPTWEIIFKRLAAYWALKSPCDEQPVPEGERRYINIFNFGNGFDTAVQHGLSTGVRETATSDPKNECRGVFPCEKRFKEFYEDLATPAKLPDGTVERRIYMGNVLKMVCRVKKQQVLGVNVQKGERSDKSMGTFWREWQMVTAMQGWIDAFGDVDESGKMYVSVENARTMLMEGRFPEGWQRRAFGEEPGLTITTRLWESIAKRFFSSEKNKLPCDDDGNEIVDPAAEREEEQEE